MFLFIPWSMWGSCGTDLLHQAGDSAQLILCQTCPRVHVSSTPLEIACMLLAHTGSNDSALTMMFRLWDANGLLPEP